MAIRAITITETYYINQLINSSYGNYEVISCITGEVHFFQNLEDAEAFAADPVNLE